MDIYRSDPPLPLPPAARTASFDAAELIFYGVDHSGDSFEALVFLNSPEVDIGVPLDGSSGFAGSFVIFGHGGCVGDEGHCDVPSEPEDPFDLRALHPLTPQTKIVDISDALKRAAPESEDSLHVTVLPVVPAMELERADVLFFSAVRLVLYDQLGAGTADLAESAAAQASREQYWDAAASVSALPG